MGEEYYKWLNSLADKFSVPMPSEVWQAAWNAALEKAAKECENMNSEACTCYFYAEAIRALKEE